MWRGEIYGKEIKSNQMSWAVDGKWVKRAMSECPLARSSGSTAGNVQRKEAADGDVRVIRETTAVTVIALCLPRVASPCVRLSVRPSVRHTRVPRLHSSRRRNTFRTVRSSDGSGFLSLNFVVPSLGDHHERECETGATSLLKAKIWPMICNNLETVRDGMQLSINH